MPNPIEESNASTEAQQPDGVGFPARHGSEFCEPCGTQRGNKCWGHCVDSRNQELRISGTTARIIILNCHSLLRRRFYNVPLWSMVGHITGHGSGNSMLICQSANLDPHQAASSHKLRDYIPNDQVTNSAPEKPTI